MTNIKKHALYFILCAIAFVTIVPLYAKQTATYRKKIIILTCPGGHETVCKALKERLQEQYDVHSVNVFQEVLKELDPLRNITNNRCSTESLFETFIASDMNWIPNIFHGFSIWGFNISAHKSKYLLRKYFEKEKPDLVISIAQLVNGVTHSVTQELNIPFIMLPIDFYLKTWINGLKCKKDTNNFCIALPYTDQELLKPLLQKHIPKHVLHHIDFPLPKKFYAQHITQTVKKDFNIPKNKPVILLLMGSRGSKKLYQFAKMLAKIKQPAHLVICTGRHKTIGNKITSIRYPSHISRTIIGFTDRIPELMAIADLYISKSGPVCISEALHMKVPLILDHTSAVLAWEKMGHRLITKHSMGHSLRRLSKLPELVDTILSNPITLHTMKKSIEQYMQKNKNYEIVQLVEQMLGDK